MLTQSSNSTKSSQECSPTFGQLLQIYTVTLLKLMEGIMFKTNCAIYARSLIITISTACATFLRKIYEAVSIKYN